MQALKDRLIREAIEDIEAELTVRAFERQQYLAAIVNGFQPSARALDMALPARLLQAATRIGRGPLALAPPNGQNGQADGKPKELPPPETAEPRQEQAEVGAPATPLETAGTEGGAQAGAEETQAPEASGDTEELVRRIQQLRAQEPPAAWAAIAAELGLSDYALRKVRKENGLED
jgi:hypothetical protein